MTPLSFAGPRPFGLPLATLLTVGLVALGLGACGDDDGPTAPDGSAPVRDGAPPPTDTGPFVFDGAPLPPPDCTPTLGGERDGDGGGATLQIGTRDASGFRAWTAGETVPFAWGFQGGTMVMPVLRVEGSGFTGDVLCVHSRVDNAFTDGGTPPDSEAFVQDVEVHPADGGYETDPLFDMVTYDSPEGRALRLRAELSIGLWAVESTVDVRVGPEGALP